jgi:hypothetical protein
MAFYSIGRLSSYPVSYQNYTVTEADPNDTFAFRVTGNRRIGLYLYGLSDDADLYLYGDTNNNGIFDSGDEVLSSSAWGGTTSDVVDFAVSGNNLYFAQVVRWASVPSISYNLDLSATFNVGNITTRVVERRNETVTRSDPTDVFKFNFTGSRNINIGVTNIRRGDADLKLYEDTNLNGIFDSNDTLVASSMASGTRDDIINYNASGGTYFAEVSRYAPGSTNRVSYNLMMGTTTASTGSNILAKEFTVNLNRYRIVTGRVNSANTTDTYYFTLGRQQGVNIRLDNLSSDADIRLIRDINGDGRVQAREVIRSSTIGSTSPDQINGFERRGDYFLQVYQYSGNTSYRLTFDQYST